MAEVGVKVVIAARNRRLAERAVSDLQNTAQIEPCWEMLDLSSLSSVRAFVDRWDRKPLHILINNAGVMACPLSYTQDGFEMQIGTNHFGHYLLSILLRPALETGAEQYGKPSRLVSVSSGGHRRSPVDFGDPNFLRRAYDPWIAYGQSKTANALFALGFDHRFRSAGIRAFSVSPGSILTPLQRHMTKEELIARGAIDETGRPRAGLKSPQQGAATSVWAAVGDELEGVGGEYLEDCAQAPPFSDAFPRGVRDYASDPEIADRLWDLSALSVF